MKRGRPRKYEGNKVERRQMINRVSYIRNRDKTLAANHARRLANPDKIRAADRAYYAHNKDKRLAAQRAYMRRLQKLAALAIAHGLDKKGQA